MTKQHELIAVEPSLKESAIEKIKNVLAVLRNGQVRLNGATRTYQPADEKGEQFQPEITVLAVTVPDLLKEVEVELTKWTDVAVQKEIANTKASAPIMLKGTQIIAPLPVGALLNLEAKLLQLKQVIEAIPTLDPSEEWALDVERKNVWKSAAKDSYRTQKITQFVIASPATDKHPAQVQPVNVDVRAGTWTALKYSGVLSEAQRNVMVDRANELLREVKMAREKANDVTVDTSVKLGSQLFSYVLTGQL